MSALVGDGRRHRGHDVEALERLAGALASLRDLRHDDVADVGGVAEPEHHAVADLAGQPEHRGGERRDVDGQLGPGRVAHEAEARGEALARRRVLAAEHRPHRSRVLAHLGHRLADRLAEPVLHGHLMCHAQAEHHAAAGQLVDRGGGLRRGRGRARVDGQHAGAELDALVREA